MDSNRLLVARRYNEYHGDPVKMSSFKKTLSTGVNQLSRNDPILAEVIRKSGPPVISPNNNYYWSLVDSIISQQLSVKSAAAIEMRFKELFNEDVPVPEHILKKSIEDLRAIGLSRAKASYIRDLAQHIVDHKLDFASFSGFNNEQIISKLIDVKGIGEWTAHMFLIFCMGRLDVLAVGDLGIKKGIQKLYGLRSLPSSPEIQNLATKNNWRPYESVACWYIWLALDNKPSI